MPVLEDVHDFAHPVEGDEAWSESYYFNCYDPASDIGFYTRIGIRPNEGRMDVGHTLWLPGTQMGAIHGLREQHNMIDDDLEVAGVRYERVVPLKEWHLTCDADAIVFDIGSHERGPDTRVSMDVTFSALTPAIGADGQNREGKGASAATRQSVGKGHLEQAGRWKGWIQVGEQRFELAEARGNRDKSWGPRRWGGPRMWRWFSINIGDDVHFGGIRIGTDDGDLHRGWVWRDGEHASIRHWDVRTETEPDGLVHKVSHVRAIDSNDRVHELRAEVLRVGGVPRSRGGRTTVVLEGLARWTYEGRTGHGIAEYLHQLDDEGRPVVAVQ